MPFYVRVGKVPPKRHTTFYKEDGKIVLKPANAAMDPIYPKEITIQGLVVGLVRKFKSNGTAFS